MKKVLFKVFCLILCLLSVNGLMAQVTTASLSGMISDGKEPIPGAEVLATYLPTGVEYHDVTDVDGMYHFLNVIAGGPYTLVVKSLGYQSVTLLDIELSLADNNNCNVVLHEESFGLNEVIIMARGKDNMSSAWAGSITTLSPREIGMTPTTTRSLNDVLILTPQANTTSDGLAVGGGNYRQSHVTVDGAVFNNSFGIGQNLPAGGAPISLEAMDQLSISITPYDVRQSGFVGGAIQATTKSGTNQWKMSVYDYFQHRDMQGKKSGVRDEFGRYPADLKLTDMLRNTIGFTVGGPLVKDKLFFFLNAEYDVDNNPGQSRKASTDGVAGGQYNRPTVARLTQIHDYLLNKYNYEAGKYDSYSFNTPDWKVLARLDWNINSANRLTVRYSYTANKMMSYPSSSVSPFGNSTLYNRYLLGRASPYAMYFQNTCYYQEQNFSSLAAEWNTRFMEGRATNTLRATWSHQNEPRSFDGGLFPTVDILEPMPDGSPAVYTTFGVDPFTYGNTRDVQSVSVVDELGYRVKNHALTAGISYDFAKAKNGFMQMGAGYYLYGSWDDFVNDEKPLAFAITHSNRDDLQQQYPSLSTMNVGAYFQDEWRADKRFNITYGVRLDVPIYPSLHNENKAFTQIFAETTGWRTDDVPTTSVSISPRVGFNWDVLGNRKLVIRGGTGYFVGTIPMVWLVSAVSNSNTMQTTVLMHDSKNGVNMHFHDNIPDMLKEIYAGSFKQQNLPAPSAPTILSTDLKMPSTWKTSLAIDYTMPGEVKLGLEGIFNRDVNSISVSRGGLEKQKDGLVLTEGVDVRNFYKDSNLGTHPFIVHNSSESGYYASLTAKVGKSFYSGFSVSLAYTYSMAKTINDGLGDQVSSVFSYNTNAVNGSNEPELGYSSYVSPHRLLANISYVIEEGKHASTTLSLYYEGSNVGYVVESSYTRWTPTMSTNVTNEGGSNNVIYIPTEAELEKMTFVNENNKADFNHFITEHKTLNRRRGQYAERGCMTMPWHNQLNFKLKQNLHFADESGRVHNMEIGWDVRNLLNLFHRDWGNFYCVDNTTILKWENGVYTFDPLGGAGEVTRSSSVASTWSMAVSLKYYF